MGLCCNAMGLHVECPFMRGSPEGIASTDHFADNVGAMDSTPPQSPFLPESTERLIWATV